MAEWQVIIVGGAPAGLSAALFAARRGLKTLIITKNIGGQIATTVDVENYPGLDYVEGHALGHTMLQQATKAGAEVVVDTVTELKHTKDITTVTTTKHSYTTQTLILTHGKVPRNLDVPGEQELLGHGVYYSAGAEIDQYQGQSIVIVGGGSSAFTAAKRALSRCREVWLVHRNNQFRAEQGLIDQVLASANVHVKTDSSITKIVGTEAAGVTGVVASTPKGQVDVAATAVFIEVGFEINTALIKGLVELDQLNRVIVDERQATSVPGIFAAGDITNTPFNQAIISAGDGAKAALAAFSYLNDNKPVPADWGRLK